MTLTEYTIIAALYSIVLLLVKVVWNQFNKRHETHVESVREKFTHQDKHLGVHDSKLSDMKADLTGMQVNISNHSEKFDEITDSVNRIRIEMMDMLRVIDAKIDAWRERRSP
jgi:hypothetical protein